MEPVYRRELNVRLHDVNHRGKLKITGLFDCFQDAASEQSAALGYSLTDLLRRDFAWVVSRYHLKVLREAGWGEDLTVATWRSGEEELFALREFEVTDANGRPVAVATGSFALIDRTSAKRVSPADYFPDYPVRRERMIDDDFASLPRPEKVEFQRAFQIRKNDLDINRHVNNTLYLAWAMESVPDDIFSRYRPVEVEVAFRGEALFGDRIVSRGQAEPGAAPHAFLHTIVREKEQKELTGLRTAWEKIG